MNDSFQPIADLCDARATLQDILYTCNMVHPNQYQQKYFVHKY